MGLFTPSKCSGSSPNIKTEHRTSPNIPFLAKTELRTSRTSQKTEQFANIELFVPPLFFTLLISFELREYISDSSYMVKKNLPNFLGSFNLYIQHYRKYVVLDRIQIWWTGSHQIWRKYWKSSKLLEKENIFDESSFKKFNKLHRVHFFKGLSAQCLGYLGSF